MNVQAIIDTAWPIFATIVAVASMAVHFVPSSGPWVYVKRVVNLAALAEGAIKGLTTGATPTAAEAVEGVAHTVEQQAAAADAGAAEAKVVADL